MDPPETMKLYTLNDIVFSVHLSSDKDSLFSKLSTDGLFYVHDLRIFINSKVTCPISNPTVWIHVVPLKVTLQENSPLMT